MSATVFPSPDAYATFDGWNDRVTTNFAGTDTGGPSGASAYSISFWMRGNTFATNDAMCGWWDGGHGIFVQTGTGNATQLLVLAGGGTDFGQTASGKLSNDTWYHVALVYDGGGTGDAGRLKCYLDGSNETLTYAGGRINSSLSTISSNFSMGDTSILGRYFNGSLRDVRCYNDALTADEVTYLYTRGESGTDPTNDNLVGHWPLADGSGTTAKDYSVNGNDGTAVNIDEATFWNGFWEPSLFNKWELLRRGNRMGHIGIQSSPNQHIARGIRMAQMGITL